MGNEINAEILWSDLVIERVASDRINALSVDERPQPHNQIAKASREMFNRRSIASAKDLRGRVIIAKNNN